MTWKQDCPRISIKGVVSPTLQFVFSFPYQQEHRDKALTTNQPKLNNWKSYLKTNHSDHPASHKLSAEQSIGDTRPCTSWAYEDTLPDRTYLHRGTQSLKLSIHSHGLELLLLWERPWKRCVGVFWTGNEKTTHGARQVLQLPDTLGVPTAEPHLSGYDRLLPDPSPLTF